MVAIPKSESHIPDAKVLWWAYAFAPAVAPVLFAISLFLIGMISLALNPDDSGTPVGVIMLLVLAMTVGSLFSHLVAGVFGMPIAFFLRSRKMLNGYTIHAATLGSSLVFTILLSIGLAFTTPTPGVRQLMFTSLVTFALITPCVLLSATTFWWIVRNNKRHFSLRTLGILVTVAAVIVAVVSAIMR